MKLPIRWMPVLGVLLFPAAAFAQAAAPAAAPPAFSGDWGPVFAAFVALGIAVAKGVRDLLTEQVPPAELSLPGPLRVPLACLCGAIVAGLTCFGSGQSVQLSIAAAVAAIATAMPTILIAEKAPPIPPPPPPPAAGAASKVTGLAVLMLLCGVGLTGCTPTGQLNPAVAPAVAVIDQVICKIVSIELPNNGGSAGSICDTAATALNGVLPLFDRSKQSAQTCHLVPITPDGVHGEGVVCDWLCTGTPTAKDPCPGIDQKLPPASSFALKAAVKS